MFSVRTHEMRTLDWWFTRKDDIDFSPPYQRKGGLWSPADKAYLVDSILNEFDIPKIYLADFTLYNTDLNTNNLPYAVVDGRQRLEAIFDFFEDKIALNKDFVYVKDSTLQLADLKYSDLRKNYPKIASIFTQYNLQVMSVITDDISKINDLFVRLNRNKPLTGAEIRNAMQGVVPDLIRNISEHPFFRENIKFATKRGQDKNAAAKLLLIEFQGRFVDTKRVNLDRFVETAAQSETGVSQFESAAQRVYTVLDAMTEVFTPKDTILSSEGQLPLYYWLVRSVGVRDDIRLFLISFNKKLRANQELAKLPEAEGVDQELLNYSIMNRSTNDQTSFFGRYRILEQRYLEFMYNRQISNVHLSEDRHSVLGTLAKSKDWVAKRTVAKYPATSPDILEVLALDANESVRFQVALNPKTPLQSLLDLGNDGSQSVREQAMRGLARFRETLKAELPPDLRRKYRSIQEEFERLMDS